ncbi:MAG TPA: alpha/beta hydrolase [Marmoricola sp.]|nr:alpha/beta hydrolase [Marmoricola sp.]HNI69941.1 alpha/beta hydrolase [Marmoricola sp.]
MSASAEQFARVGDLEICYQTFGDPSGEPLILVMGLGGPMIWWDDALCQRIADEGFHVVRFDNRDTGRSSKLPGEVRRPDVVQAFLRKSGPTPYTLKDMGDDAFGVLDTLGWDSAHVVGISMGGMIAQTMAITQPERVRSLVSMSSSSGRRTVGWQSPKMLALLAESTGSDLDSYVHRSLRSWQIIASPAYPLDLERLRQRAIDTYHRGASLPGQMRHILAVASQPDRTRALGKLQIPVTVLHGRQDLMVHVSGGKATAAAVPGSELLILDGWGHDLPEDLFDVFANTFTRTAARAVG